MQVRYLGIACKKAHKVCMYPHHRSALHKYLAATLCRTQRSKRVTQKYISKKHALNILHDIKLYTNTHTHANNI